MLKGKTAPPEKEGIVIECKCGARVHPWLKDKHDCSKHTSV